MQSENRGRVADQGEDGQASRALNEAEFAISSVHFNNAGCETLSLSLTNSRTATRQPVQQHTVFDGSVQAGKAVCNIICADMPQQRLHRVLPKA